MEDLDPLSDIKAFRKATGLSQFDLANFLGVNQKTVSRWERGVDAPSTEALSRMRLMMGGSSNPEWMTVFSAIQNSPVGLALVDNNGRVLMSSAGYHCSTPIAPDVLTAIPTVLVIDDDRAILKATRAVIGHWNLPTIGASDGEEALRITTERPGLAIIDFSLPGELDGVDTAVRLRKVYPDMPVLMISGEITLARKQKMQDARFPLLPKPVDPAQLKVTIQSLLPAALAYTG